MGKTDRGALKKHLSQLKKEELAAEVLKLAAKFDVVKQYYQMELSTDTT